jgi:hypothetical protein
MLMPQHEQGFDVSDFFTGFQFVIVPPSRQVLTCHFIGMTAVTADLTTERLLVGAVFAIGEMTDWAFPRSIPANCKPD